MFNFIWVLVSSFLIILILIRIPSNDGGLASFATKSSLLGSPNSAEKLLNNITWFLIIIYFLLAVKFNFST